MFCACLRSYEQVLCVVLMSVYKSHAVPPVPIGWQPAVTALPSDVPRVYHACRVYRVWGGGQRRFPPICIKNTFSLYRIHLYLQKCILRGTIKFVSVRSSWCFTIISPKNLDAIESLTNVLWRPLIIRLHRSYLVYQHSEFPLYKIFWSTNPQVRERLQAALVLEVVFSALYVSDDTEFELIELCRKYRVRLLFLDFKSSILHKT